MFPQNSHFFPTFYFFLSLSPSFMAFSVSAILLFSLRNLQYQSYLTIYRQLFFISFNNAYINCALNLSRSNSNGYFPFGFFTK